MAQHEANIVSTSCVCNAGCCPGCFWLCVIVWDGGPTFDKMLWQLMWVSEYYSALLSAQSWQYRERKKPEVGTMSYSYRMTPRVLYSEQYHRQHCTLHAFEQFGALYMHNRNDKHPTQPGFEPSRPTSEFRTTIKSNEPDRIGPAFTGWSSVISTWYVCIEPALCQRLVFTVTSQQTQYIKPMVGQCLASVADGGPTLTHHWFKVPCLLDSQQTQTLNRHWVDFLCFSGSMRIWPEVCVCVWGGGG